METEICHNCKREVPQQNYLMHVAHCARNMTVCPVCGEAVPKAHLKEHRIKEHALIECPACRNKVQSGAMKQHRATQCGRRTCACEYCELELPKDDLVEHELYCGARTERCDDCGELVMHKYRKLHLDSNHGFLKLKDEPGPTPSWEGPLNSLNAINSVLPPPSSTTRRHTNEAPAQAAVCVTTESVPLKSKKLDEENGFAPTSEPPPRDAPRTFVPAYDASDDLRAKVKLARHDLNSIKNTYLCQGGDDRIRQLQHQSRQQVPRGPDLLATNRQPRTRFTTNLVPYEKNKSFKVNALDDDERAAVLGTPLPPLQPLQPLQSRQGLQPLSPAAGTPGGARNAGGGFFNYLGGREESNIPVVPLSTKVTTNNNSKSTGAVPRNSRKKGPAPPIPSNAIKQNKCDGDIITLPCEFCGELIAADFLVQHETACRPDLAQLKPKPATKGQVRFADEHNDVAAAAAVPVAAAAATAHNEVELPCEFCSNLYPMSKLLSHQALCDI